MSKHFCALSFAVADAKTTENGLLKSYFCQSGMIALFLQLVNDRLNCKHFVAKRSKNYCVVIVWLDTSSCTWLAGVSAGLAYAAFQRRDRKVVKAVGEVVSPPTDDDKRLIGNSVCFFKAKYRICGL